MVPPIEHQILNAAVGRVTELINQLNSVSPSTDFETIRALCRHAAQMLKAFNDALLEPADEK